MPSPIINEVLLYLLLVVGAVGVAIALPRRGLAPAPVGGFGNGGPTVVRRSRPRRKFERVRLVVTNTVACLEYIRQTIRAPHALVDSVPLCRRGSLQTV